jgi:hypothetical protein
MHDGVISRNRRVQVGNNLVRLNFSKMKSILTVHVKLKLKKNYRRKKLRRKRLQKKEQKKAVIRKNNFRNCFLNTGGRKIDTPYFFRDTLSA